MKEKRAQGCHFKLKHDILYVDGHVYREEQDDGSLFTGHNNQRPYELLDKNNIKFLSLNCFGI